jgi:predicted MFS family arabinose efflux permease
VGAFGFPAFQNALPRLVPREHLVAAVGLSNAQWNLGRIIGPSLAGVAIALGGIGAALWCNAISFLAVIVAVAFVKVPHQTSDRRPVFAALADGLRFAVAHPVMRRMLVVMVMTIGIASPFIAFVSQVATNVLHGDARATSVLVTAQGIGAVTAAFTLGSLTKRFGVTTVMFGGVGLLCPALVAYALAPRLWLAATTLTLVGLFYGYAFTSFASVAQHAAPDDMRGRVLAVNFLVLGIMFPVGTLIQGQIADAVGLRWTTAGSGLVLAFGLVALAPWQRRAAALVTS